MHSNRMRTALLLTVSHSIPCILGGGGLPKCPWMQTPRCRPSLKQTPPEVYTLEADPLVMWPVIHAWKPPPVYRMTHRCKNITLPQIRKLQECYFNFRNQKNKLISQYHSPGSSCLISTFRTGIMSRIKNKEQQITITQHSLRSKFSKNSPEYKYILV